MVKIPLIQFIEDFGLSTVNTWAENAEALYSSLPPHRKIFVDHDTYVITYVVQKAKQTYQNKEIEIA